MARRLLTLLLTLPLIGLGAGAGETSGPIRKLLDIEYSLINEMSGIVRSRRFDDVYWLHNDSGDEPRLFAFNGQGRVIFPDFLSGTYHGETEEAGKVPWPGLPILNANNVDWEDIAIDDEYIYIAEMGNNGNARRDLGVYMLPEPSPFAIERARALKFLPVRYPDQDDYPGTRWHFDSEAMFVFEGRLYFLSKNRKPGRIDEFEPGTTLYRLDTSHTDEVNVLTRVEAHAEIYIVTAADLSPDGSHLAILCNTEVWVFDRPREGDRWLSTDARMTETTPAHTGQAEAIAWMDDDTLLIGNEASEWFVLEIDDMKPITGEIRE